jgi:DNA repair protein RecN (Recombination protein N)
MLHSLHIRNYALISSLDIDFGKGLSTITGETGAGKSILLGALSLILGQRAESEVLKDKSLKCVVEGLFHIDGSGLEPFFEQYDLDYQNTSVLRREINPNGKSRAFINDTPVNLSILRELGLLLVDIHSQHENLDLASRSFQLKVLDLIADNAAILSQYRQQFKLFRELESQHSRLLEDLNKSKSDLEYYSFQYKQLEEAGLKENEEIELEAEQKVLSHSEELRNNLGKTFEVLGGETNSINGMLREALTLLSRSEQFMDKAGELHDRLQSVYIEVSDITNETERLTIDTEVDPERLEYINQRLDLLFGLMQKHHVSSINELINTRDSLKSRIENISSSDDRLEELNKSILKLKSDLGGLADSLSMRRQQSKGGIEKTIAAILKELGIPNARFTVLCEKLEEFSSTGRDRVGFLFSANRQVEPQEVSKVASGGEISRLMLAVKSLLSQSVSVPTIVFDEIDSGVSGEIANRMGNLIRSMSSHLQVINITHLPQIAAKGHNHFLVYKKDQRDATLTNIRILKPEERVLEIAKMLSGETVTEVALENARQLLAN